MPQITVTLSEELAVHAGRYTDDLNSTVMSLLVEFIAREESLRRNQPDDRLGRALDAFNAFHAEHGLLSDEFPVL